MPSRWTASTGEGRGGCRGRRQPECRGDRHSAVASALSSNGERTAETSPSGMLRAGSSPVAGKRLRVPVLARHTDDTGMVRNRRRRRWAASSPPARRPRTSARSWTASARNRRLTWWSAPAFRWSRSCPWRGARRPSRSWWRRSGRGRRPTMPSCATSSEGLPSSTGLPCQRTRGLAARRCRCHPRPPEHPQDPRPRRRDMVVATRSRHGRDWRGRTATWSPGASLRGHIPKQATCRYSRCDPARRSTGFVVRTGAGRA